MLAEPSCLWITGIPNVIIPWPNMKIEFMSISTFSSSPSINVKLSTNNIRKFAVFASSIHSKLRSYIFYTPITAAAWQRIGYQPIVIFVGDFTDNNNASLSSQLN
ncbi:unnamed protein product, partial [Rotaria sordida]